MHLNRDSGKSVEFSDLTGDERVQRAQLAILFRKLRVFLLKLA